MNDGENGQAQSRLMDTPALPHMSDTSDQELSTYSIKGFNWIGGRAQPDGDYVWLTDPTGPETCPIATEPSWGAEGRTERAAAVAAGKASNQMAGNERLPVLFVTREGFARVSYFAEARRAAWVWRS